MKIFRVLLISLMCSACAAHKESTKIVQDNNQASSTSADVLEQKTEEEKLSADLAIMQFDVRSDSSLPSVTPPLSRIILYNPTFSRNFETLKGFNLQTTSEESSKSQKSEKEYSSIDRWDLLWVFLLLVLVIWCAVKVRKMTI